MRCDAANNHLLAFPTPLFPCAGGGVNPPVGRRARCSAAGRNGRRLSADDTRVNNARDDDVLEQLKDY